MILEGKKESIPTRYADRTIWRNSHGFRHRLDGPAVETNDGLKAWWTNGMLHRLDGPAVEWPNGTKLWYVNDKRHRIDGPAVVHPSGHKEWWVDGKRHRVDGPAIIDPETNKESWYINGKQYEEKAFKDYIAKLKEIEKGSKEAGANLDF